MHHLVWARAGRQLLVGRAVLHHTSHSSLMLVKVTSLGGRPVLAFGWGGKRRTRPPSSPPPQRAEKQPSGDGLPSMCSHLGISQPVPSSPLLSHAVQQGQVSILSGFGGLSEMHQKKRSL